MERHTPDEGAVRDALRDAGAEADADADAGKVEEAGADGANGAEAPAHRAPPTADPDELTVAQRERDEYLDLAKRTQADFENYRKRAAKDIQAAGSRVRSGLIREVLPVVDNIERALASAPEGSDEGFVQGVRLVHNELQGVLARAGVEAIEPAGEQFDPNVHEALSVRSEEGAEAGVVLDVVEKGYRTADGVIRPARVVVAG